MARDLSNPTYKFITRLNEDMFSGTLYSHDALGTKESFDATTGEMLKDFYKKWYAPNNAILVIAGDVDPSAVLAKVKEFYGNIPQKIAAAAARDRSAAGEVGILHARQQSALSAGLRRLSACPERDSPDFAAVQILARCSGEPARQSVCDWCRRAKRWRRNSAWRRHIRKASVAYSAAVLPADGDAAPVIAEMRKILADYAANGVPAELVEAAKRREIAGAEFRRNSIPGLAEVWSDALAAEGRNSPDEDVDAMKRVTLGRRESGRQAISGRPEIDHGGTEARAVGRAGGLQRFWRRRAVDAAPTKPVDLPPGRRHDCSRSELPPLHRRPPT